MTIQDLNDDRVAIDDDAELVLSVATALDEIEIAEVDESEATSVA